MIDVTIISVLLSDGDLMNPVNIGKFISEQRKKNNLTQKELADKLNVTSQAISKWENGRGIPDIEMLKSLSEIFNVDIEDLLNGKEKYNKKNNNYKFLLLILIIILVVGGLIIFTLNHKTESFNFYPIATDNDAFNVKGVVAFDKNKKSIYISEVIYEASDEVEYKALECVLYEALGNVEKKISKWGNIENISDDLKPLSILLKEVEFNIDNYDCSCESVGCDNLYLRVNALNKDNKVISYNIPLQINATCEK